MFTTSMHLALERLLHKAMQLIRRTNANNIIRPSASQAAACTVTCFTLV